MNTDSPDRKDVLLNESVTLKQPLDEIKRTKQPYIIGGIVVALLLAFAIGYFIFIKNAAAPQNQQQVKTTPGSYDSQNTSVSNAINNLSSEQILITEVPNFDNLTTDDLPNFKDVRDVYSYRDYKIIAGINRVIAYNPTNKRIIWQNNNLVLKNIHYVALASDYLYLVTDRSPGSQMDFGSRNMLKVNIQTGKAVKSYFDQENRKLVNLQLFTANDIVWGKTQFDGVFALQPKDDHISFYSFEEATKNKAFSDIYNAKVNAINLAASDFNLNLPTYLAISPKISQQGSDKYYIFAKDAVYVLEKGKFPKLFKTIPTYDSLSFESKVFVTSTQKYALLLRSLVGSSPQDPPTVGSMFFAVLLDLDAGTSTNLLQDKALTNLPFSSTWEKRLQKITYEPFSRFEETADGVSLKENDTSKEILYVNFPDKKLVFR